MVNQDYFPETIELSLPANAAYVSAARLTASSIANRLSFDINEIEDVKSAVSEACTFIIKRNLNEKQDPFKINFTLNQNRLEICLSLSPNHSMDFDVDDMSILMIKALMDVFTTAVDSDGVFHMKMAKIHKEISFD